MQCYDIGLLHRSLVKYLAQIPFQGALSTAVTLVQLALCHPLLCMSSPIEARLEVSFPGLVSLLSCMARWESG